MPRTSASSIDVDGLTAKEREELLAALLADPRKAMAEVKPSPLERVIAGLLPSRSHREDCPAADQATLTTGSVELYEQTATAPAQEVRNLGVAPGGVVVTARCVKCAGFRHYRSPLDPSIPTDEGRHRAALLATRLQGTEAAVAVPVGELDSSL